MGFLMLFFVLFGLGALLGLAYVGVKAIFMTGKGLRFAAKDLARVNRESADRGRELAAKWEAKRQQRLRERP